MGNVVHTFTSGKSDGGDASLVRPSNWNANHTVPTDSIIKNNFSASTDPTTGDDTGDGYEVGSRWINTSTGDQFTLVDGTVGAAIWVNPSAGGADLSAFRLASVADATSPISLGAFGDEMEYADQTALDAGWTSINSTVKRPTGSSASTLLYAASRGISIPAGSFASSFEVGFLVTGHEDNGGMVGIGLFNSSGVGIAMTPYSDGNSYLWEVGGGTPYLYQSTGPAGGVAYTAWEDGRPVWFFVRYDNASHWRLRRSEDGTTMTTLVASASRAAVSSLSQVAFGRWFSGGAKETVVIHKVVYGTPDLGL